MDLRRYPEKGGQFAIIWVDLLYEDSVPATAKLLYGEIYRLSNADGWCDASNEVFCDLLGCSENTVRNLLKALVRVGQISIHTEPCRNGKGGTLRRIFCGRRLTVPEEPETGGTPKFLEGGTLKNLEGVPPKTCGDTYTKSNSKGIPPIVPREVLARCSAYAGEDGELLEAVLGLLENRAAAKKSPVKTVRAMNGILNKLDKLSGGDRRMKLALLDKATVSNWLTVFPLKPDELPDAGTGGEEGVTYI